MADHRYWRLNLQNVSVTQFALSGVELYSGMGNSAVLVSGNGTATATQINSSFQSPASIINQVGTANTWVSNDATLPQYFNYDFGSGNTYDVQQVGLSPGPGQLFPTQTGVQWSDDGSSYSNYWGFYNRNPVNSGEYQIYTDVPDANALVAQDAIEVLTTFASNAYVSGAFLEILTSPPDQGPANATVAICIIEVLVSPDNVIPPVAVNQGWVCTLG